MQDYSFYAPAQLAINVGDKTPVPPDGIGIAYSTTLNEVMLFKGGAWNYLISSAQQSSPLPSPGVNGQVLETVNGAWAAAYLGLDMEVSRVVPYTSSGTGQATPAVQAGEVAFFIEACGGGAGGAAGPVNSTTSYMGAGGYPGTIYRSAVYPISALPAAFDLVIGAGGASVTTNGSQGNSGGNTTVTIGGVQVIWAPGGYAAQFSTNNSPYGIPAWSSGGRALFGIQFAQSTPGVRGFNNTPNSSAPTVGYGPGAGAHAIYTGALSGAPGIGGSMRVGGAFQNYMTAGGGAPSGQGSGGAGASAAAASLQYGGGGASGNFGTGGNGGFPGGGGAASGAGNNAASNYTAYASGAGANGIVRVVMLTRNN